MRAILKKKLTRCKHSLESDGADIIKVLMSKFMRPTLMLHITHAVSAWDHASQTVSKADVKA